MHIRTVQFPLMNAYVYSLQHQVAFANLHQVKHSNRVSDGIIFFCAGITVRFILDLLNDL